MIFNDVTQFVVLGLLLFAGWFFGMASHPGGKKWRRAFDEERADHAAYRDDAENRARDDKKLIAELQRSNAEANRRLEELEKKSVTAAPEPVAAPAAHPEPVHEPVAEAHPEPVMETPVVHEHAEPAAEVAAAPEVHHETIAAEPVAAEPTPEPAPVVEEAPRKTWFGLGGGDHLATLKGVDAATETKLREQGIKTWADIAGLSHEDELALEQRIGLPAGTIQRDQWREQAALLLAGRSDEHRAQFETV